ncbi:MAG TPA: LamG domain-containing protein [Gammaproteobacteria bacterium]|nr:LamG domain-containing protein [Gammaproteobacteria bacterium]
MKPACPASFLARSLILGCALLLAACGGGATTETQPSRDGNTQAVSYKGPAPATSDVQNFKLNLWDKLSATNRCGGCHSQDGPASPPFVRYDDINLAYAAANTLVNLASPADSRLVTKVAGGHNCWLEADSACGAVITAYIESWANGSGAGNGRQIQLEAPVDKAPGASKNFPADATGFGATVHPLLTAHCAGCHVESSPTAQAPFFASSDVNAAYEAAKAKIDLDTPANSRLVVRLRNEFHNCWSGDCQADANAMEAAIQAFADGVPVTQVDPQLVISRALRLTDGIIASGGSRVEDNVIALYEFKTSQGTTAYDTSGVEPALHLTLSGNVSWVGGWGIEIVDGKAQGTTTASKKLHDLITATGEYSIEAWVVPANVTQEGPARIISYSGGTQARNFTLGQTLYNYNFLPRSSTTDANGEPALSTADAAEVLQATQQHVVVTYDPANGRRIYVNGQFTGDVDPVAGGNLNDWDDSFALVLGNEVSGDRLWKGKLRLVAIHNRALTPEQIMQNYKAGVGEKFYLLFGVSALTGVPQSYILFEVSQFDNYSYLFNKPTFISLDPNASPAGIPLRGMRIGINGKEAVVGQAYRNLDLVLGGSAYDSSKGQPLSRIGTVIALEKGPEADEFFLTFEQLGNNSHVVTEPAPLAPPPPPDAAPAPDIGLRTFEEIHNTMAEVTDVSPSQSDVQAVFDMVKQQLPTVENIEGFLSAHQMAVSQLAIEYCSALVDGKGRQSAASYFPGFDFSAPAGTAFDSAAKRDQIIDPLLSRALGSNLATQPDPLSVKAELNNLMDRLTACASGPGATCNTATRTTEVVKASCAAVLGSAALLLQ